LAILLFLGGSIQWSRITGNLRGAAPAPLLLALFLVLPNLLLQGWKWHLLVRARAPRASYGAALRSVVAAMGVGLITPGRVGEVVRGNFLGCGDPLTLSAAFIIDKALNIVPLLLVAGALAHATAGVLAGAPWWAAAAAAFWLILRPQAGQRWLQRISPAADTRRGRFLSAFATADPATVFAATLLSCLIYALVCGQFALLLQALAPGAPWSAAAAAFLAINLAGSLPFTPAGLGTREAGAVVALEPFGIGAAAAVNASLLLFIGNLVLPAIAGAWFLAGAGRAGGDSA
jgi:uncharacterized membrane protein YbhN (UPF0104 family)